MNNIYKVIWSKAKNCYVVASEIARSHTKSATGSEKIGGVTRRSLLASLMALSLLCGGLGVASAVDVVHVDESVPGTAEVYTKAGVDTLLNDKADKTALDGKADKGDVDTNKVAIQTLETGKANTSLNNLDEAGKSVIKTTMTDELEKKADKSALNDKANTSLNNLDEAGKSVIKATMTDELAKKADATNVYTKDEVNTAVANVETKLADYAKTADVDTKLTGKADKATTLAGYGINDAYTRDATDTAITTKVNEEKNARELKDAELSGRIDTLSNTVDSKVSKTDLNTTLGNYYTQAETNAAIKTAVDDEKNARENAINGEVTSRNKAIADAIAQEETNRDAAITKEETKRKEEDAKLEEKITENTTAINNEKAAREAGDTDLSNRIGTVDADGKYIKKSGTNNVSENLKVLDIQAKTNADAITQETADREAAIGELAVNGNYIKKDKNVSDNLVELDKQAKANADAITETNQRTAGITRDDTRKETSIEGKVTVDTNGNIKAEGTITSNGLNAGDGDIKTNGKVSAGDVSTGTLETTGNAKIGGDLTVNGKLNVDKISMKNGELKNGKKHDSATTITADEISNLAKVTEQGNTTESQFTHNEKGTFNYAKDEKSTGEWKRATSNVTADGVSNKMTDFDKNMHTYYQTATETREQLVNGDKSKSNFEKKTAEGNTISITEKDAAGNPKSSLTNTQTVNGEKTSVTNKDSSSTIKQGADQIRYNVTSKDENTTSSSIEVKADGITNTSKDGTIINDAKDIENNATGDITNTAQNGSIINKAENGNISNTAQNVTNEGTESVTNKVRANEVKVSTDGVDIKAEDGKKITESVGTASRVVKNDKITDNAGDSTVTTEKDKGTTFGKAGSTDTTNIYGDSIKTGTIKAKDTTTDKLTAGAAADVDGGRLTVDANDGVKGSYKSGGYTSKSYILDNTLKSGVDNGKEPTDTDFVGSRTDHYMVGDKAKLDETVKDADGSNVTNKTSTGTVTTITDGTTTTTTEQGVKDITNTAKNGTITNDAKDIVNNAKDTITNTAGTSITNQVKDSKVTTDVDGTTFENKTAAVSDGGTTTTKINGNRINTGRVDANELGVSDKDDQGNTAGLSVKAGEGNKGGIKGSVTDKDGNKTYTKVTATENSFQVQDKDGKNTNHQVNTKDKSENTITNGTKANTVTSTADGTTFINSEASAFITDENGHNPGTVDRTTIKGNTITTGKVTMDYADVMKDLGVHGNTTLGEAGKDTTLTVNSKATFNNGLTVTNGETKLKNTTIEGTLNVTENATFQKDVTANSFSVNGKTYIDSDGLNANNQVIRNVADGSISEGSKDAVNGGQLYQVKNDLEGKVNKVGANAAAMANLHPMEFDPDCKWNIAAAMGNYGSETATAIGAFYRPNEDVMVNFSTAFGTGENMVGGGVSVRLGKGSNKLSREESNALKDQVNDLTARMDALLSVLNPNMSKDFPDVPENHWAYEAVSRLAGNDIVQGYPDGEFHGERTMTRYEMAEIIYNALSRGAEAERELVEEFKPELQAMAASEKATAERAEG